MSFRTKRILRTALLAAPLVALLVWIPASHGQGRGGRGNASMQAPPRDWTQDMQMKIMEPFTLASVGDMIILRPAANLQDPAFQNALKVIRDSDVGFGNFESMIRDETKFEGPLGGMFGTKEVAADVKTMGFQVVNRAGNHLMDSNQEGLFDTLSYMEQAGLVYGGVGRNPVQIAQLKDSQAQRDPDFQVELGLRAPGKMRGTASICRACASRTVTVLQSSRTNTSIRPSPSNCAWAPWPRFYSRLGMNGTTAGTSISCGRNAIP